jgi:hypothetical protein
MTRNTFNTIRFINLAIDILKSLVQGLRIRLLVHFDLRIAFANILLPVKQGSGERFALNSSLGDFFGGY